MQINDYPLVLTVDDMCAILQCGREKMYEYARSKGFPKLQHSRTIRVPREAFFDWLESATKKNDDEPEGGETWAFHSTRTRKTSNSRLRMG